MTNVCGDGQKPWYVALTYDRTISAESGSTDDDTVKNVYVNTDPSIDGTYVIVENHHGCRSDSCSTTDSTEEAATAETADTEAATEREKPEPGTFPVRRMEAWTARCPAMGRA